jgi:hypothetical protein
MYRQLYMGGGIGSLDAGAPSIKYTGDINHKWHLIQIQWQNYTICF